MAGLNKSLQHTYVKIEADAGRISYGGNQSWLSTDAERSFGCGLIASADVLRYIRRKEGRPESMGEKDADPTRTLTKQQYLEDIHVLSLDFRVRGPLGITGFGLARRMNRVFRREKLPYRSKWSVGRKRFLRRLEEMLDRDIPVLLSVGPCFFHRNERLPMYEKKEDGTLWKSSSMNDHYVTATGMEEGPSGKMVQISSWGEKYYISLQEYVDHVKKFDNFLFSSLLYIRRKGQAYGEESGKDR